MHFEVLIKFTIYMNNGNVSEAWGNIGPTDASCIQPNISRKKM